MKKIFAIILIATAFITTSASAQRGGRMLEKQTLIDSLKITDAVADSVIALRQQAMGGVKNIMSDESLTRDQKREKMMPLREEMKTKLKQYLTEEQMAKLQEMEMNRRPKQE